VMVGVKVDVAVFVTVAVAVAVLVSVTVGVTVLVAVAVDVAVDVRVDVLVAVRVGVTVDVSVGVKVEVDVGVGVEVGVYVGPGLPSRQLTLQTSRPTESSSSTSECPYRSQAIELLRSCRMRRFARSSCAVIWRSGSYPSVVPAAWTEPAPPKAMTTRSARALAFLRKTGRARERRGFVIRVTLSPS
jgi:hypothetical protein